MCSNQIRNEQQKNESTTDSKLKIREDSLRWDDLEEGDIPHKSNNKTSEWDEED